MIVNILLWCLFGLIAGALAKFIMPGKDSGASGFVITIVLGILGAVVGGWLGSKLFGWNIDGFNLESMALAVGGALVLLIVYRLLMPARA